MKDKYSKYALIPVLFAVVVGVYCIISSFISPSIRGTSENDIWKVIYKKNSEEYGSGGWTLSVNQIDQSNVNVKKLEFFTNTELITDRTEFSDFRDIDGTVYTLHPFSYPDLYLGEGPKRSHTYSVKVQWEDDAGNMYEDTIELK